MTSRTLVAVVVAALLGSVMGVMVMGVTATAEPAAADVPSGAVMAFDSATCPPGWSAYAPANGRVVVGLRPGGTLGGVTGGRLEDLEVLYHNHAVNLPAFSTEPAGNHSHVALTMSKGEWRSGSGSLLVNWTGDGIDEAGSGYYPVAVTGRFDNGVRVVNTNSKPDHTHLIDPPKRRSTRGATGMPYVQLKYCEKN